MKRGHVTGHKRERKPTNWWYASEEFEELVRKLEQAEAARQATQARQ